MGKKKTKSRTRTAKGDSSGGEKKGKKKNKSRTKVKIKDEEDKMEKKSSKSEPDLETEKLEKGRSDKGTGYNAELEGEDLLEKPKKKKIPLDTKFCHPTLCQIFYQDQEFMNIENFYALKKLEWRANKEHEAAIKIQNWFRRWLIKQNMILLNEAAIKIQRWIRGFLARRKVKRMREELEKKRCDDLRNRAATCIQAHWRGYWCRKNSFDFHKCRDLQQKNMSYKSSIDLLNDLEGISLTKITSKDSMDTILRKLNMNCDNLDDIIRLSPARVEALIEHIERLNAACYAKGCRPAPKGVEMITKLKAKFKEKKANDSIDRLFPEMPDDPRMVHPQPDKVQRLKDGIRKLRETLLMDNQDALRREHHLLRTYQLPGVLSNITSHCLTPYEKKLKEVKFWEEPPPPPPPVRTRDICASGRRPFQRYPTASKY